MTISSRTPEGEPAKCPLCMASIAVEPTVFIGDACCPRCGQLLWFIQTAEAARLFDSQSNLTMKNRILSAIANQLGIDRDRVMNNPSLFKESGVDSLDQVELAMAIEEEFDRS